MLPYTFKNILYIYSLGQNDYNVQQLCMMKGLGALYHGQLISISITIGWGSEGHSLNQFMIGCKLVCTVDLLHGFCDLPDDCHNSMRSAVSTIEGMVVLW